MFAIVLAFHVFCIEPDALSQFEIITFSATTRLSGGEISLAIDPLRETSVHVATGSAEVEAASTTVHVPSGLQTTVTPSREPLPASPVPSSYALRINVEGGVRPFLVDDLNRSVGFNPSAEAFGSQIPGATYRFSGNTQTLTIPDPGSSYELVLSAMGEGSYYDVTVTLDSEAPSHDSLVSLDIGRLSGLLTRGKHIGTSFEVGEDGIDPTQLTSVPTSGTPESSRMLFARGQPGNAMRIQVEALAASTLPQ